MKIRLSGCSGNWGWSATLPRSREAITESLKWLCRCRSRRLAKEPFHVHTERQLLVNVRKARTALSASWDVWW